MKRSCGYAILLLQVLCGTMTLSADEGDLIEGKLKEARGRYDTTVTRITGSLLSEFDQRIESDRKKAGAQPNLVGHMDRLKAAKQRFEATGKIPSPDLMGAPADAFERDLKKAKDALDSDFDKAIAAALRLRLDPLVGRLRSQKRQFESDFQATHPPRVVARWLHVVGRGDRYIFDFASDGRVLSPSIADRTWEIQGKKLILKTRSSKAPSGYWIDVCRISPDGQHYTGRNQDKTEIQGTRLELD